MKKLYLRKFKHKSINNTVTYEETKKEGKNKIKGGKKKGSKNMYKLKFSEIYYVRQYTDFYFT